MTILFFDDSAENGRVLAISCNDILRDGSVKEFSKDDILTLSTSTPQQLETCLFILGKDEIDATRAKAVWTVIKQVTN